MDPVCLYIGNRPIYWYGVMISAAFLAGIVHWRFLGKREGRDASFVTDLATWLILAGISGARAGYILANFREFIASPWDIVRLDRGGLVFYGGFAGASAALIIFARCKRERLWHLADFTVTALPLGHAIGRIGCFLNGCCYGTPADLPFAVQTHGAHRHPVQLYSAILNFAIYFTLLRTYPRQTRDGRVFAFYLMLYPAGRFIMEFLRGDARLRILGFTATQYTCIVLLAGGIALWFLAPLRTVANAQYPKSDRFKT